MKYISKLQDLPDGQSFIVLFQVINFPIQRDGQAQSAVDYSFKIIVFDDEDEMKEWIKDNPALSFKAMSVNVTNTNIH